MEDPMASSVHISLGVSDLARAEDFYRKFFGEPVKSKPDYVKFVLGDPELHLALQPAHVEGPGALSHLGIRLDSAERVGRWKADLERRGLPVGEERREDCCYALQEKFWLSDPDGNRWEIYTVLEDLDQRPDASPTCCTSAPGHACC